MRRGAWPVMLRRLALRRWAATADAHRNAVSAEAMSQTPPTVTDELSAALLEELGAPALVELAARVGFMNSAARTNIALGIKSEEFSAACGLRPLATRRMTDVVAAA